MNAFPAFLASIQDHWLLAALMLLSFTGGLVLVPWIIVRLPADYFRQTERKPLLARQHPVARIVLLLGKNLLGVVLILAGIAMLVLPGQGLLTILIGILLLDFPGKFHFERWLVRRKPILKSANWLRRKSKRPPFSF